MRSGVFLVLVLSMLSAAPACGPAREPVRAEPPAAPLVIGTSPPMPAVTATDPVATSDEAVAPTTPLAIPARDPRISHGKHRPRGLLVTELQGLEALFASTPPSMPDRPILERRLADTYAELGRVADGAVAANAHRSALRYYELLAAEYPQSPQLDEALYYAALEHEIAGNATAARRGYYELIRQLPRSKLVPLAYFAFGEMFFAEAAADPSRDQLAEQAYREVLKFPPAQNAVYTEAQRRLAEIGMRKGAAPTTRP